jgi:putative transposase
VSRRFVAATETALAELLAADLSKLDLVGLMIDGVHFGEHTSVVALGIGIDGTKHPLSLVEGSTENATLVTDLIVGLPDRGLDVTRPILVVLNGSKTLRRAVLDLFDRPVLGRCQLHYADLRIMPMSGLNALVVAVPRWRSRHNRRLFGTIAGTGGSTGAPAAGR